MVRSFLFCFLLLICSICKPKNLQGKNLFFILYDAQFTQTDTSEIKEIPLLNLSWHEIQSDIYLEINSTVSVLKNDSILLDTLYSIESMDPYEITFFVDSLGQLTEIKTNRVQVSTDTTIYISVIENNGCSYFEEIKVNVLNFSPVDIYSIAPAEISIYPNPNSGIFTLNIKNAQSGIYSLVVRDAISSQVYSKDFNVKTNIQEQIFLNQVPGYYICIIYYKNQIINHIPLIIN